MEESPINFKTSNADFFVSNKNVDIYEFCIEKFPATSIQFKLCCSGANPIRINKIWVAAEGCGKIYYYAFIKRNKRCKSRGCYFRNKCCFPRISVYCEIQILKIQVFCYANNQAEEKLHLQ